MIETFEQRAEREMLEEAGAELGDRIELLQTLPLGFDPDEDALIGRTAVLTGVYTEVEDDGDGESGPRVGCYAALAALLEGDDPRTVYIHPGDFRVIDAADEDPVRRIREEHKQAGGGGVLPPIGG